MTFFLEYVGAKININLNEIVLFKEKKVRQRKYAKLGYLSFLFRAHYNISETFQISANIVAIVVKLPYSNVL